MNHLIVPRHWRRFALYAPRVRSWLPEDLSYIEESVVDHIAFGRNPGYILPRLTHLKVTASNVSAVHLHTLMLCPALRSVAVLNAEPNSWATRAMKSFFYTLADRAPELRKLTVHWGDGIGITPAFIEGLTEVFANEDSALESVNLWSPMCTTATIFGHLSKLRNLTTLHLNLLAIEDATVLLSRTDDKADMFPSLQNLFLAGHIDLFPKIVTFLKSVSAMISLRFSVREYPRTSQLSNLLHTIANTFPRLQIIQLNVPKEELLTTQANRQYITNTDQFYHNLNVIRPLLTMRYLQAVHLDLGVPIYLTDGDLRIIGSAWPSIRVLSLCSNPYCEYTRSARPTCTLFGLLELARVCTRLQHLGLFIDCAIGLTESILATTTIASRTLSHLDVGRSWINEPSLTAGVLSGALPALRVLEWTGMDSVVEVLPWGVVGAPSSTNGSTGATLGSGSNSGESASASIHVSGWREVFELLPIFRSVRASERRALMSEMDGMNVD